MTRSIRIDWSTGAARADALRIEVDGQGALAPEVARLCKPPETTPQGKTRYRFLQKVGLYGQAAECVVDTLGGKLLSVTLLFDLIKFFDKSILESGIVKAAQKEADGRLVSPHPAVAKLQHCEWGDAEFLYDPKQGDLSLTLQFK